MLWGLGSRFGCAVGGSLIKCGYGFALGIGVGLNEVFVSEVKEPVTILVCIAGPWGSGARVVRFDSVKLRLLRSGFSF